MKPIFRIGRLRVFKQSNWNKKKEFKLEVLSIEVDFTYKFVCVILLNFEFEINW